MDRQELDRGDAEALDVVDDRLLAEAVEGAALRLGHGRVQLGEAAHMRFVEDRPVPGDARLRRRLRVGGEIADDAFRHEGRAVALAEAQILVGLGFDIIAVMRGVPGDLAGIFPGIGVEQQLVGVEAMPLLGLEAAMDAIAVALSGLHAGQVAVPDLVGVFRQGDAGDLGLPALVEQAELDTLGARPRRARNSCPRRHAPRPVPSPLPPRSRNAAAVLSAMLAPARFRSNGAKPRRLPQHLRHIVRLSLSRSQQRRPQP